MAAYRSVRSIALRENLTPISPPCISLYTRATILHTNAFSTNATIIRMVIQRSINSGTATEPLLNVLRSTETRVLRVSGCSRF